MSGDLVKRARDCANGLGNMKTEQGDLGLFDDLADRIESLQHERDAAIEAERVSGALRRKAFDVSRKAIDRRDKLREALDKLASAAIPIFTDEAGLVHFDAHPMSVALWDATADARAALAETEGRGE